jgi:hypothetical protein
VIPIPVETIDLLAVLNLPKEMADNIIFKEHKGLGNNQKLCFGKLLPGCY